MSKIIPESKWKWFGNAGHFICARDCQFHMCTQVGAYLISTVGELFILGNPKMQTVGFDRLYETYVFEIGGDSCECGCGVPIPKNWGEIDSIGSNDAKAATEAHYKLARKYARITHPEPTPCP